MEKGNTRDEILDDVVKSVLDGYAEHSIFANTDWDDPEFTKDKEGMTAEGRNETEAKYFNGFKTQECPYLIKFHKAGHLTDPTKLAEFIRKRWDAEEADTDIHKLVKIIG